MASIYVPLDLEEIEKLANKDQSCPLSTVKNMVEEIRILRHAIQEMDADSEAAVKDSMAMGADAMKNAAMEILSDCHTIEQALKRVGALTCEVRAVSDLTEEEIEFIKTAKNKKKPSTNLH